MKNKSILDFNATNGGFLRLASSVANKTAAVKYTPYLDNDFEQMGIDIFRSIDSIDEHFDVITLFNIIENIPSAEDILQKLASKLKRGGLILIETQNEHDALLEYYESKSFEAFINMNCRSKLFNIKSLNTMLRKAHLKPLSIRQIQKFPFSNHLHWLLTNRPDGHKKWGLIDKIFPSYIYQSILKKYNTCDIISFRGLYQQKLILPREFLYFRLFSLSKYLSKFLQTKATVSYFSQSNPSRLYLLL